MIIGIVMLFNYNIYHRSVYLGSSNKLIGQVYTVSGNIQSYFNLRETNNLLIEKNSYLESRVLQLEEQIKNHISEQILADSSANSFSKKYRFVNAQVINNSVSKLQNYITLNKGKLDGIEPEMGVIDQNGIVGIVSNVSDHYAVVISCLNPKLRLSAKLKGNNFYGSVVWNGKDPEYGTLEELPRHVKYNKGDTLVTSGYSDVFPEGLIIGFIDQKKDLKSNESTPISLKYATQFGRLNFVRVIVNKLQKEQQNLESEVE